jgi:HNH endonuclease
MGEPWTKQDRRYRKGFRWTAHAQWMMVKWGGLITGWLILGSLNGLLGVLGFMALATYVGLGIAKRHRREIPPAAPILALPSSPPPLGERNSRTIPQDVKIAVAARDGGRCRRCGSTEDLHFDHVIPWSRGGANTIANIQLLCGPHNRAKGADDIPV